ncbi:MAG: hypothetical protein K0S55_1113 [Clostridia bacterium]|nr:hypothetical protein [Clostridia bacterium]
MKKIKASRLSVIMILVMFTVSCISALNVSAAVETMNITLRIEGINSNMYYKAVEVPYTDSLTLQAALTYIDSQEDSLKITGADAAYITDINGDTAGKFGGYDGWMFKVNGINAAVGIDSCKLAEGDSVLLYYGDPFGVGMQYPEADYSGISNGIIKFTSSDTTYDADYNPTVTVNPVAGATVTWYNDNTPVTYTTDNSGEIKVDSGKLEEGFHAIQITKTNDAGIPLVLRFAPDYSYELKANNPQTSDSNILSYIFILSVSAMIMITVYIYNRKRIYEK